VAVAVLTRQRWCRDGFQKAVEPQAHFRGCRRLARVAAAEDDVFHLLAAQALALCSPITHVMASATLLLPQPFGPTIAVTPWSKASSDRSEKDLKPLTRDAAGAWLSIADFSVQSSDLQS
jgi:hypothetical protein